MANRSRIIERIQNTLGLPEIMEGMRQAGKYGESWVPETQNFRGGPAPYAAFQGKTLKPDLTDSQAEDVLGYGGSFGERQLQRDSAGAVLRDTHGQAVKTSGNRIYGDNGEVIGFGRIDDMGRQVYEAPSGPAMGIGYTVERLKNDYFGNGTLNQIWRYNHPLGSSSSFARSVLGGTGEAKGNRAMTALSAFAPAVIVGGAAGNVFAGNIISGEAGRAPGTAMVEPTRDEDGKISDRRSTENVVNEVGQRWLLGRTGRLLPEYEQYASDKLEHGIVPESPEVYYETRRRQWEKKTPLNLFGLFKTNPTDAVNGEASFTQLGYTVPVSAATSLGGSLTAAGVTGHALQKNPAWLGQAGSPQRHRRSAAALGASMAAGALIGKAMGTGANDLIQRAVNPENHEFKELMAQEIERRRSFINDNANS